MLSVCDVLQGKWDSLREAADAYSELSQYARKEKQWLLQRVRILPFHDTPLLSLKKFFENALQSDSSDNLPSSGSRE